jgi:hypothetical protein
VNGGSRRQNPRCAMAYALLLRSLTGIANEHGYSLSLHGSMATDMDILLCPWTEDAAEAATVVEAIVLAVGGYLPGESDPFNGNLDFTPKPHGRLAYAVYFDRASAKRQRGPYLDISVMPRKPKKT